MEKVHSQELREQSLLPKHQKAIQMGLKGLKVEELMKEGTSDDGISLLSIGSQVFRGSIKKLPHIIGTSYFYNDPWIGLYEEDEQKLENNDEAFTVVFEAKDAPKFMESPSNTVTNPPAYAPPVPPPMQKTSPPIPPSTQGAPVPPPPPPPPKAQQTISKPGPPPPPPASGTPAPSSDFNSFQKGLAMTLGKRKAIIDGEVQGDLSVKNILTDESKALGLPQPKVVPNQPENNKAPPPPPPPKSVPQNLSSSNSTENKVSAPPPAPPVIESRYESSKNPEEMTLAEKRQQLAGVLGNTPLIKPKPETTNPPQPIPESINSGPSTARLTQNPAIKPSIAPAPPIFFQNFEEEEELNTLFRPNSKPPPKEKKGFSGLFDTPQENEIKNPKNEPKKTRAEGLFKFIEDDDTDTASIISSDIAKKKLGKTTTERPSTYSTTSNQSIQENPSLLKVETDTKTRNQTIKSDENPFLFNQPAPPAKNSLENPFLFSTAPAKPKQTSENLSSVSKIPEDPLSLGSKVVENSSRTTIGSNKATSEEVKVPRPSIKELGANINLPSIGGPPPRQDNPVEVSHDITLSKPFRRRKNRSDLSKFDDFDDDEEQSEKKIITSKTLTFSNEQTIPSNTAPLPAESKEKIITSISSTFSNKPVIASNSTVKIEESIRLPSFSDNYLPEIGEQKPRASIGRKEVSFDPLMGISRASEKKVPPKPPAPKEEEKKTKPRPSLFDDDDEELSFRPPAKNVNKEPVIKKGRGSLFDDD